MTAEGGPRTEAADILHAEKYRGPGESFREAMGRVASALSDGTAHYREFRDVLLDMRFMPGGRIQSAMGSTRAVTPYNCFVSGTIEDSFIEGNGSIMNRAVEACSTMRMGGGIGYDFSTLRPRGSAIKKLGSVSGGPVSFMEIFNAICLCVASSGHRRGAQMGVMRIDHPDIEEFIRSKHNERRFTGFNISVAVTDHFMQCLLTHEPFPLQFGGEVYKRVDPVALWEVLMRSTWDWAEPGVLFIDQINRMNNLAYCEKIAATNPCGEQPLPPHGACLLGSFNLARYVEDGAEGKWINVAKLIADIPAVVRAMDNVVDRAVYPLYEQEKEAHSKRRMGLGVTGVANAIEAEGPRYGDPDFVARLDEILAVISHVVYEASVELAREKGSFPLFDPDAYVESGFVKTLPSALREMIARHGIRNSHLLSIAPTGTISLCADNVSSGVEPVLDYTVRRMINYSDGPRVERISDYGRRFLGVDGRVAADVTTRQHLEVLKTATARVDSAVSKTCVLPEDTEWAEFERVYVDAWRAGCKGCTTYTVGGKRAGVIESDGEGDGAACRIDPDSGRRNCE